MKNSKVKAKQYVYRNNYRVQTGESGWTRAYVRTWKLRHRDATLDGSHRNDRRSSYADSHYTAKEFTLQAKQMRNDFVRERARPRGLTGRHFSRVVDNSQK